MRIEIHPDPATLADAAAGHIAEWLADPEHRTVGLAGGSTPAATYERLRSLDLPWADIAGWMTDERHVPIDHPDSNAGMARRTLFDHVPATLHPVPYLEDAGAAAAAYAATLDGLLAGDAGLVVLGIGTDGHTASLFPGTAALDHPGATFVSNWVSDQGVWRLTATLGLLARAERTIFLVTGEAKSPVIAEILAGGSSLPAALVSEAATDPIWLLDAAAAGA